MPVTKCNSRSTIFQNKAQRQENTWAITLKETQVNRNPAQMAMQRNLHHPDDHGEFSHLLTSIN